MPGALIECGYCHTYGQQVDDQPPEPVGQHVANHAEAVENDNEEYRLGIGYIHPGVRTEGRISKDGLHAVHA